MIVVSIHQRSYEHKRNMMEGSISPFVYLDIYLDRLYVVDAYSSFVF